MKNFTERVFAIKSLLSLLGVSAGATIFAQRIAPAPYSSNVVVNSIRIWDATYPQSNPDTLIVKSLREVKQTTQYFDGLGRPIQTVLKNGSLVTGSSPVDLVTPVVYDSFDRERIKYLPFSSNGTGGNTHINDGLF